MAKVIVIYDSLLETANALNDTIANLNDTVGQLEKISASLSDAGATHDDCFSNSIENVNALVTDFKNYVAEVEFLQRQCQAAADAFAGAEADNIKITAAMLAVVNDANILLGNDKEITADDVEVELAKKGDYSKDSFDDPTKTEISDTWAAAFPGLLEDDPYIGTNTDLSTEAESPINNTEDDDGTKPTPVTDSNGGGGQQYRYSPTTPSSPSPSSPSPSNPTAKPTAKPTPTPTPKPTPTPTPTPSPSPSPSPSPTPSPSPSPTPTPSPAPTESPMPSPEPTPAPSPDPTPTPAPYRGGEYDDDSGYVPVTPGIDVDDGAVDTPIDDNSTSVDDVVSGNKYTKVPSSPTPIVSNPSKKSGSGILPIAAGLTAAAAAGIGAKAYMDHKNNNENDDDMEVESEEWEDNNSYEIEYDEAKEKEEVLDEDDYGYNDEVEIEDEVSAEPERYGARTSEELADIQ